MAEIRIEQKQRSLMPLFVGLALAALLVIGLTLVFADTNSGAAGEGPREVGNPPEKTPEQRPEKKKDETPRRLQQWADHVPDTPDTPLIRAA